MFIYFQTKHILLAPSDKPPIQQLRHRGRSKPPSTRLLARACQTFVIYRTCFLWNTTSKQPTPTRRAYTTRWWFLKYVLFSPLFGKDSHFDQYFSDGLNHQLDFGKMAKPQKKREFPVVKSLNSKKDTPTKIVGFVWWEVCEVKDLGRGNCARLEWWKRTHRIHGRSVSLLGCPAGT